MSTAAGEVILSWLNGAIADRERVAGDAASEAGGTWREDPFVFGVRDGKNALVAKSRENRASSIVHIALNDPASVLRRCAADRKLLELHAPQQDGTSFPDGMQCRTCSTGGGDGYQYLSPFPCPTIVAVAEGYGWTGGE